MKKYFLFSLLSIPFLVLPISASAVVQSLNGLTSQNQTFSNDINVQINSSGTTHTLNWNGVLDISRGGTGSSSFTNGSIPFISGGIFSEDNASLFWDGALNLGADIKITPFPANFRRIGIYTLNATGTELEVKAGSSNGSGDAGVLTLTGGRAIGSGNGGPVYLQGGHTDGVGNGGDIYLSTGGAGSGQPGKFIFDPRGGSSGYAILDFDLVETTNKIFTFPNTSGSIPLLEGYQTFSGVNKFEATTTNSTIYVGSAVKSGCIALGDSDRDGITYITANDGVLSATSTKPSICQ